MQITHEQAQRLIQRNLDRASDAVELSALSAHLRDCADCRVYERELQEVETTLRRLLRRQWAQEPAPLSTAALTHRRQLIAGPSAFVATRTAVISLVVMALFFSVWQFMLSSPAASSEGGLPVLPAPTPSSSSTSTSTAFEGCQMALYTVVSGDTLAAIAARFSVSEADIRQANDLQAETVSVSQSLIIPICHFTPTGTAHPATLTTTDAPARRLITSTPGG